MNGQQEQWQDKERAGKYAKQTSLASKLVYARLARRVAACLEPPTGDQIFVDLGSGPGFLGIELGRLGPQARIIGVDPSGELLLPARLT
jgi:ubiquinone/menaquinone biosynthesis C-methylase UbiE